MPVNAVLTPLPKGHARLLTAVLAAMPLAVARAADPPARAAAKEPPPAAEVLTVPTSDGVDVSAWFYAAPEDEPALATVLLLHDLGGSHETLEPLAEALQAGGCSVVVPDLRGHGESSIPELERRAGDAPQADLLKSSDFLAMTASSGGRLRNQCSVRGDLESVRNWIKERAEVDKLGLDRLYVVGSGLGAAIAAGWTVNDAAWPTIASGRQGGDVKGLVMISPAFAIRGLSLAKPLALEPLKTELPIMLIAGGADRDAIKVFDQLKRSRPTAWFDSRMIDESPATDSDASLVFLDMGGRQTGDTLASARAADPRRRDPAGLILAFIKREEGR